MIAELSECPPFILLAHCRPGLPLVCPQIRRAWLVEPGQVCRGLLGQRDRWGKERVLLIGLSNRRGYGAIMGVQK